MKIYLCHSTGYDYAKELYEPIKASALLGVHDVMFPHDAGADAHSRDIIAACDLVIAEVSFPSTGMGIELGWADAAGKRIICVHRADAKPSGALRHIAKDIVTYDGPADLAKKVEEIVANAG